MAKVEKEMVERLSEFGHVVGTIVSRQIGANPRRDYAVVVDGAGRRHYFRASGMVAPAPKTFA